MAAANGGKLAGKTKKVVQVSETVEVQHLDSRIDVGEEDRLLAEAGSGTWPLISQSAVDTSWGGASAPLHSHSSPLFPAAAPLFRELSKHTKDKITLSRMGKPDKVCRVVDGQIPEDLKASLELDFTETEVFEIAHRCDVYAAAEHNEPPTALWIFGPPAVGKSTVTNEKAAGLFGQSENAVTIDGDVFRKVHKGFQMVSLHASRNGLVHKDAWDILKGTGHMDKIKEGIVDHALQNLQHLKIPECAMNTKRTEGMLKRLEEAGYEMHAICLWAPKSVTEARGRPRSVKEGKAFSTNAYAASTKNTLHFGQYWEEQIAKGNEHFKTVEYYDNTLFPSHLLNAAEFEVLTRMTDQEATEHARMCESTKQARDESDKAAIEARAQGLAPRLIVRARIQAWKNWKAGKQESKGELTRTSSAASMHAALSTNSRLGLDPEVLLAELYHCRLEGFIAGVGVSVVAMGLLYFTRWSRAAVISEL